MTTDQQHPDLALCRLEADVAAVPGVLGRAHADRFATSVGQPSFWDSMRPEGRDGWLEPVRYLVPPVQELVARVGADLRERARWTIGAPDTTLGAGDQQLETPPLCREGCGPYLCTRGQIHPLPHAAGDGRVVLAVWGERP